MSISETMNNETVLMLGHKILIVTEVTLMVNIILKGYSTNFKWQYLFASHG